jgi:hypothetical protein
MTTAEFWQQAQGGLWRTARKPFVCRSRWRLSDGTRVWHAVNVLPRERYFDTNDHDCDTGGYWRTMKMCAWCAQRELHEDMSYKTP